MHVTEKSITIWQWGNRCAYYVSVRFMTGPAPLQQPRSLPESYGCRPFSLFFIHPYFICDFVFDRNCSELASRTETDAERGPDEGKSDTYMTMTSPRQPLHGPRGRSKVACTNCHVRKVRCDLNHRAGEEPCSNCWKYDMQCK